MSFFSWMIEREAETERTYARMVSELIRLINARPWTYHSATEHSSETQPHGFVRSEHFLLFHSVDPAPVVSPRLSIGQHDADWRGHGWHEISGVRVESSVDPKRAVKILGPIPRTETQKPVSLVTYGDSLVRFVANEAGVSEQQVVFVGYGHAGPSPEAFESAQDVDRSAVEKALLSAFDETLDHMKRLNRYFGKSGERLSDDKGGTEAELVSEAVSAVSRANAQLDRTGQTIRSFNDWLASKSAQLEGGE